MVRPGGVDDIIDCAPAFHLSARHLSVGLRDIPNIVDQFVKASGPVGNIGRTLWRLESLPSTKGEGGHSGRAKVHDDR